MYEYEVLFIGTNSPLSSPVNLKAKLNYLGEHGWNLVSAVGNFIILKRTVQNA